MTYETQDELLTPITNEDENEVEGAETPVEDAGTADTEVDADAKTSDEVSE